jgi:hypothetical protein
MTLTGLYPGRPHREARGALTTAQIIALNSSAVHPLGWHSNPVSDKEISPFFWEG